MFVIYAQFFVKTLFFNQFLTLENNHLNQHLNGYGIYLRITINEYPDLSNHDSYIHITHFTGNYFIF